MEAVENDLVQASFEKTLASFTELITATLRQALPGRFEEAKKLCEVAQAISQARAKRATTQKETPQVAAAAHVLQQPPPLRGDDQMMVGGVQLVDAVGPPHRRLVGDAGRILFDDQGRLVDENGIAFTGALDANALMRHMLMAFGPHAQTGAEANRARVAAEEADELKSLVALMEGTTEPERAVLDRRVKQLLANVERRSDANKAVDSTPAVPVVSPDDSRGHPPVEGGTQADALACVPANGVGGPGNDGAPRAGLVDQVGAHAVV